MPGTRPIGNYDGAIEAQADSDELRVFETRYAKRGRIGLHAHRDAQIFLVVEGRFSERLAGRPACVSALSVSFLPAEIEHTVEVELPGRAVIIDIAPSWLERHPSLPRRPLSTASAQTALVTGRLRSEIRRRDTYTPLMLEFLAVDLLVESGRDSGQAPAEPPSWLERVREIVCDASPGDLSLATLASCAGVHPAHLSRAFRRAYGCAIGEYGRRVRVMRTVDEVAKGTRPLIDIALDAGFADQSHFTRVFRRLTGTTPGQLRRGRYIPARAATL